MDKHIETDEVFILHAGSCKLLLAGNGEFPGLVEGCWMESGKVYCVHKGVWHSHVLLPGSSVLVVENAGTCGSNTSVAAVDREVSCI
jgi:hypothetical protein